ncbi:GNAT family N-acetyltransferase [Kitasatospora griseola]|uniref:GNAT family N-acetyltransferase n=1 Tax=Kitasatospora griseola TaxID=2064 RepID=UPI003445542B
MRVVHRYPHRREIGYIHDTSVLAAHRGHGLGRAMKARQTQTIAAERPDLELIGTITATTHMIGINHALGYETARTMNWVETTAAGPRFPELVRTPAKAENEDDSDLAWDDWWRLLQAAGRAPA